MCCGRGGQGVLQQQLRAVLFARATIEDDSASLVTSFSLETLALELPQKYSIGRMGTATVHIDCPHTVVACGRLAFATNCLRRWSQCCNNYMNMGTLGCRALEGIVAGRSSPHYSQTAQ